MANHSYVKMPTKIAGEAAEQILLNVVKELWGERLVVESYEGPDAEKGRLSWRVYVPNSAAKDDQHAMKFMKAPDEDFGFVVWYRVNKAYWDFRHSYNSWESWAQNKVQHTIARKMGIPTYEDDGTDDPQKVDPEELRNTYYQYVTRNFPKPHSASDKSWFDRCLSYAPEGFRE